MGVRRSSVARLKGGPPGLGLVSEHLASASFLLSTFPHTSGPILWGGFMSVSKPFVCSWKSRGQCGLVGWICPILGVAPFCSSYRKCRGAIHPRPVRWNESSQPGSTHNANWSSLITSQLPVEALRRHCLPSASVSKGSFH